MRDSPGCVERDGCTALRSGTSSGSGEGHNDAGREILLAPRFASQRVVVAFRDISIG
jgi:hypothetical protein